MQPGPQQISAIAELVEGPFRASCVDIGRAQILQAEHADLRIGRLIPVNFEPLPATFCAYRSPGFWEIPT